MLCGLLKVNWCFRGNMLLWNVGQLSTYNVALYPKRQNCCENLKLWKRYIFQQCISTQPDRRKTKTFKDEKTEPVHPQQFGQIWALHIEIQVLCCNRSWRNSHKTKCWICDVIWLEWSIQKMCRAYYRIMRGEPKSVNEEEETNTMSVVLPMDQGIIRSLKHKYHRCFDCNFMQRITFSKECYKVSLMPYKHLQHHGMLSVWKLLSEGWIVWNVRTSYWRWWRHKLSQCIWKMFTRRWMWHTRFQSMQRLMTASLVQCTV